MLIVYYNSISTCRLEHWRIRREVHRKERIHMYIHLCRSPNINYFRSLFHVHLFRACVRTSTVPVELPSGLSLRMDGSIRSMPKSSRGLNTAAPAGEAVADSLLDMGMP